MSKTRSEGGFDIRGLMLDPARQTERHEFYFDLLPQLAAWGFNTLWWHFVDNEGFRLKIDSRPELTSAWSFTKPEMRRLIEQAEELGIDVVPEVEALGHAGFVTRLPEYREIAIGSSAWLQAIRPCHPESLSLLRDVIGEVAELFPSESFHAGLDEVDLSACAAEGGARGKPRWWMFARHARAVHEIVTGCGKRMIMWADHIEHDPELLDELPRDIVLCHWQYGEVRPDAIRRSLDAGFEVITAPSLCYHGNVCQPGLRNLDPMDAMCETTARNRTRGVLGMVNTWWCPQRGLRDAHLPAVAYTGRLVRTGRPPNRIRFMRRFVREYFGLDDADTARALYGLHERMTDLHEFNRLLCTDVAGLRRLIDQAEGDELAERAEAVSRDVSLLEAARDRVTDHLPAFDASVLAGRFLRVCLSNARKLARAYELYERAARMRSRTRDREQCLAMLEECVGLLAEAVGELDGLSKPLAAEWRRTRPTRVGKEFRSGPREQSWRRDMVGGRVEAGRAFLAGLRTLLQRQIAEWRRGGAFPGAAR